MPREAAPARLDAVRRSISTSTDSRVAATRTRIITAVESLSAAGDDITVSSITAASGVSRATFYTHFSGIDALALHLQEQAFHDIASTTRAPDIRSIDAGAMEQSQRALIAHYAAFRSLYAGVLAIPTPRGVESRVAELMKTEIRAHITDVAQPPADIDPEIAAAYIARAATGVIASWVLGEIEATEDELAHQLTLLMPRWMHTSIPSAGQPDGHLSEGDGK